VHDLPSEMPPKCVICNCSIDHFVRMEVQFSSVQFSKSICTPVVQVNSRIALQKQLKPKSPECMPEIVVCNVLRPRHADVLETVPDTWPSNSEIPITKCVVCAWNNYTRSVG